MSTEDKLADVIRYVERDTSWGIAKAVLDRFVVIDRNDLPEVQVIKGGIKVDLDFFPPNVGRYLQVALRNLAAHEHYTVEPPVDEKAVDELQDALMARSGARESPRDLARALIADGWKRGGVS